MKELSIINIGILFLSILLLLLFILLIMLINKRKKKELSLAILSNSNVETERFETSQLSDLDASENTKTLTTPLFDESLNYDEPYSDGFYLKLELSFTDSSEIIE